MFTSYWIDYVALLERFVQRVPNKQIRDVKKMFHSRAVYDREKRKLDKEALDIIQGK